MTITFSTEKTKAEKLKELMKKTGEPIIREKLGEYVRRLKEEFSQGLILPTKTSQNTSTNNGQTSTTSKATAKPSTSTSVSSTNSTGSKTIETKELIVEDSFKCPRAELFQTFTDLNRVRAFTQNSVSQYECQQGGNFSLFGDNITGHFLEILPVERLEMLWRFKSWPKDHFSQVTMRFEEETDQTKLIIQQTGVPVQFYDNTMVRFSLHLFLSQR